MSKKNKESLIYDIVIGSMLVVVVGIMPLILRASFAVMPPESVDIFTNRHFPRHGVPTYIDIFSSWKSWFLGLPAVVIAFYSISELVTNGAKSFDYKRLMSDPVIISCGIFFVFAFISTLFSDYTHTAWYGTFERNEGFLAWVTYLIVFVGAMLYVRRPIHAKVLLWGLIFSSVVMGIIGLSQFLQRDLLATSPAQWLIAGGVREYVDDFTIRFTISFGTLYNPNTFGLYTAMLTPILILAGVTYEGKRIVNVLLLVGGALMLFGIFGSRSLAGFIGFGASLAVLVAALLLTLPRRGIRTTDKRFWLACVGVVVAVAAVIIFAPPVNERVHTQLSRLEDAFRAERAPIYDYFFEGNEMRVYLDDAHLFTAQIHNGAQWITVRDASGAAIEPTREAQGNFTNYIFELDDRHIIFEMWGEFFRYEMMGFALHNDTIFGVSSAGHFIDMSGQIPSIGFRGRERWGSSRGYIFSRSFPLMGQTWLIGTGPDSFVNAFPQHDIVGKRFAFGNPYIVVDKAHNVLIQTWITKGGVAALALIFLFGFYLVTTLMSLVRTAKDSPRFIYGLQLGLLAGVTAFCVASMSTDSTIGSTGVAFVILGLGYGVNRMEQRAS